ncbi:MAG: hypothetical protein BAA02_08895 [Paenibacillaceae bacterium ZCTH02-B3]|nr:MAG: hypothetical protein BAA02_08895 [Paenibacillaceae bacterium ZCTH02-B3]
MTLRKWAKLFGATLLVGALAYAVTGVPLQASDPEFRNVGLSGWLYNVWMMILSGLALGAVAHLGFFAYLMLNYVARSMLRKPYLWVALQGFTTVFALGELVYWMAVEDGLSAAVKWTVPAALTAASALVAWRKVRETSRGAWIPAMFFLVVGTLVEAVPAFRVSFQEDNALSLILSLVPLFVCNAYQLMQLHRILDRSPVMPAEGAGGQGDGGARAAGAAGKKKKGGTGRRQAQPNATRGAAGANAAGGRAGR